MDDKLLVFEKAEGGRIALWVSAITGVEEHKPPHSTKRTGMDVFIMSADLDEPVRIADDFETATIRVFVAANTGDDADEEEETTDDSDTG